MRSLRHRLLLPAVAFACGVLGCSGGPLPVGASSPSPLVIETQTSEVDGEGHTTHGADCVTLRAGNGGPSSRICGDPTSEDLERTMVPYFYEQHAHPADPATALAIGWTSLGGGMQTMHAWVVRTDDKAAPVVVAKLAWTTDRGSAGFAIERSGRELRLGIHAPEGGDLLHEPGDWRLDVERSHRDLDAVKKLPSMPSGASRRRVARPIAFAPWPAGTRFAWFEVTKAGFREP